MLLLWLVATVSGSATVVHAAAITFDSPITQPAGAPAPADLGVALDYETLPDPPEAFYTQGFAFGGRTAGVTSAAPTRPGFGIVFDPSACVPFGTTCADNGTNTLAFDVGASLTQADFGLFSISSFSASQAYGDDTACPSCNDGFGLQNAERLRVFGFYAGGLIAQQTFDLSYGFQEFLLPDPNWSAVNRVVFQPLDAAGNPGVAGLPDAPDEDSCCTVVLDNIEVQASAAVPEPATPLVLAVGLAGYLVRRRTCVGVPMGKAKAAAQFPEPAWQRTGM